VKVVSIVGARPQFIKAAPVSRVLRTNNIEILVNTGQHYDDDMSAVFFRELDIPKPDYNLGVGSGTHGKQTGEMLIKIEEVLIKEKPDFVMVFGDTNSTISGALAAVKLTIPLAHVEAGLRSLNREMPEEHNRVLTDHCSDLLFCPTRAAADCLAREGMHKGVYIVGDVMLDAFLHNIEIARTHSKILEDLGVTPKGYNLATVHRAYNTDNPKRLYNILSALSHIGQQVILPIHPRTRKQIVRYQMTGFLSDKDSNLTVIEPAGYLDMLMLEQNSRLVLTDSGGVQKEAYFMAVPCITLRPETEWMETVHAGWNILVDDDKDKIIETANHHVWPKGEPDAVFGDGHASERIVKIVTNT
jgi:UDP-GlcNAc3NAcA epimerase